MPDGLTHIAFSYLCVQRWLRKGHLSVFFIGLLLPDIFLRGGRLFISNQPDSDFLELYLIPLHTPFVTLFICLALVQLFHSEIRKTTFILLYSGCLSHFFLDFFQRTIEGTGLVIREIGGYGWFFPFSNLDFQFSLFWAEETLYSLIILIPISIFLWLRNKDQI